MIKKLVITGLLIMIIMQTCAHVFAAGIDPNLKPKNIPGVPEPVTNTKAACEALNAPGQEFYTWDDKNKVCKGDEGAPINEILQVLGGALLMLSGGIAVIVIAVGGVMYITSRGNQQQMEYAKNTLFYGVLGIVVITFSYFIVKFVLTFITSV